MRRYNTPDAVWELWNEPNTVATGYPVADYIRLAGKLGAAVRAAADLAHVTLVGPATAGIDLEWLEQFLSSGALTTFDAVSVHPYRVGPAETVLAEFAKLRQLVDLLA
jgi:hypothetical protein